MLLFGFGNVYFLNFVLQSWKEKFPSAANPPIGETLAFIVKNKTDDRMIKEFLLHKDIKENGNPPHIQAHFADPQTDR